jgi:hypothetical protein
VTPVFFTDRDLGKQFPGILRSAGLTVERHAVVQNRVPLLVVVGSVPFPQLAQGFVSTYGRIEKFISAHAPPYIAKVYRPSASELAKDAAAPGRIELWYPGKITE